MPESLVASIDTLARLADYAGPWRALREQGPRLRQAVEELRERAERLEDVLLVALVGGSGVGKSTLLNALAGDQVAETSEMRPCTAVPMVYHPPGVRVDLGDWQYVARSALGHLVIIDTPDSDTVVKEHRARTVEVLRQCDLIVLCGSGEKYLDEATWSLLRPLRGERTLVCVETKARPGGGIVAHWRDNLREAGFDLPPDHFFRVNALNALDRKIDGRDPDPGEVDFPRLEGFLEDELNRERAARIKRSNVAGLVAKRASGLRTLFEALPLEELEAGLDAASHALADEAQGLLQARLFAEPYLWRHALGREAARRARGLAGLCFRGVEALRALPMRIARTLPFAGGRRDEEHRAAGLLSEGDPGEDVRVAAEATRQAYAAHESRVALAFARAGLDTGDGAGFEAFRGELDGRVSAVLRGPGRDRVARGARRITSWPVTCLLELPAWALVGYAGWEVVTTYFRGVYLDTAFFYHTGALLALLLGLEYFALSWAAGWQGNRARRACARDLAAALHAPGLAFQAEMAVLGEVRRIQEEMARLQPR